MNKIDYKIIENGLENFFMATLNIYEQYVIACCNLYGMVEIKQVEHIFQVHNDTEFDLNLLGERNLETHFVVKWKDVFFNDSLEVEEDYKNHYKVVKTKPYYEPNKMELLKYLDDEYFENNDQYRCFEKYIGTKVNNKQIISDIVYDTHLGFVDDTDIQFTINHIQNLGDIDFDSQAEIMQLMDHLKQLQNNTRMWLNNGFTPIELRKLFTKPSKVGRNDPCPCGSGKKYKKCCLLKIS
jgi:preprotein translocase subunit SecA